MVENSHQTEASPVSSSAAALRLALYAALAVVLMVTDHHSEYLRKIRGTLSAVTYPMLALVTLPGEAGRWLGSEIADRKVRNQRLQELEERWLTSQSRLNRIAALEEENARLRRLLESSPRLGDRVLVAELLDVDLDPFTHLVALDRGTRDGVYSGQPIADARGIMGQIELVSPISAQAVLISDPNHALPVTLNRTGIRTVAYGTGQLDRIELRDVAMSADVQTGDLVVTSGLGGRFPVGFPVGEVTTIESDPGAPFRTVAITPLAALDRARQVLLVWPGAAEPAPNDPDTPVDDAAGGAEAPGAGVGAP
ncbi:MAG: rod shape-determining protein MreC [Pseudomonadota bacterium]